jgi:hypothetical protein
MIKHHINKVKKFFTEPKIPYGLFALALLVMGGVGYAALWLGQAAQPPLIVDSTHFAIGDTIGVGGFALKVESFRVDYNGDSVLKPSSGDEFLIPTIDVTNHTAVTQDLIPLLFFYIQDAQGNVYHINAVPLQTDQTSQILPGETVREEIGFEVPQTINHPALYFQHGPVGTPLVAVDLAER